MNRVLWLDRVYSVTVCVLVEVGFGTGLQYQVFSTGGCCCTYKISFEAPCASVLLCSYFFALLLCRYNRELAISVTLSLSSSTKSMRDVPEKFPQKEWFHRQSGAKSVCIRARVKPKGVSPSWVPATSTYSIYTPGRTVGNFTKAASLMQFVTLKCNTMKQKTLFDPSSALLEYKLGHLGIGCSGMTQSSSFISASLLGTHSVSGVILCIF